MSVSTITPPDVTAPTCPPWCRYTDLHGYESETVTDEMRYHSLLISNEDIGGRVSVTVEITVQESRSLTTGEVTATEPGILVWYDLTGGCSNPVVSADDAQHLADLLHSAAVKLDEIKAGA